MRVLLKITGEGSQFSAVFEVGEVEMYSLFQTLPQRTANIIPILTIQCQWKTLEEQYRGWKNEIQNTYNNRYTLDVQNKSHEQFAVFSHELDSCKLRSKFERFVNKQIPDSKEAFRHENQKCQQHRHLAYMPILAGKM